MNGVIWKSFSNGNYELSARAEACRGPHISGTGQESDSKYISGVSHHVVVLWSPNSSRERADIYRNWSRPDQRKDFTLSNHFVWNWETYVYNVMLDLAPDNIMPSSSLSAPIWTPQHHHMVGNTGNILRITFLTRAGDVRASARLGTPRHGRTANNQRLSFIFK